MIDRLLSALSNVIADERFVPIMLIIIFDFLVYINLKVNVIKKGAEKDRESLYIIWDHAFKTNSKVDSICHYLYKLVDGLNDISKSKEDTK